MDEARAERVMVRAEALAQCSEDVGQITRPYGTPSMMEAVALTRGWMDAAGMSTRVDAVGNLLGRYDAHRPGAPSLVLGSHLDSVRNGGRYDGPLGVLVATAVVEELHRQGLRLPIAIEVVAWADEEGLRFPTAYLGSRAYVGAFEPALLDLLDADGVSLAAAMRAIGGDPDAFQSARRDVSDLLGYVEVHIEQGPVLEGLGLPVGVVTSIAGQTRGVATFTGRAGHAGTTPGASRQDALAAAAEWVLAIEGLISDGESLVATVGRLDVSPNAGNVIPGEVAASFDIRGPNDQARMAAVAAAHASAERIGRQRRIALDWRIGLDEVAVPFSAVLTDDLERAVTEVSGNVVRLPSGAGHDAAMLARITDVAMLFVRCAGGLSHHPDESVAVDDVAVAIDVLDRLVGRLEARHG